MQAVEEVPSSSASSVAPSAATTPAAAMTAASIQEFNDEQEPGWIFGVMGGSVASVASGADDLWDELVLDSGSVSTACPYAWCSDISVNNEDKVYLQEIQQRRIPSHGSRVVPLELWGPEGRVECKVKFDVADVANPVVSLGKMIESGFTFSFDDYKCYMHKGNKRVEIFRKGRIFELKMRRRWLESKVQIREVRPSSIRPGAEAVRQHNLTHCPYQNWCEVCVASKGKSDHYHREAPQPMDGNVARIQMDFMYSPASSRLLEGYKLDETKQRFWHRRVLEVTKKLEQWNVRMEQCRRSCERITRTCKNV